MTCLFGTFANGQRTAKYVREEGKVGSEEVGVFFVYMFGRGTYYPPVIKRAR